MYCTLVFSLCLLSFLLAAREPQGRGATGVHLAAVVFEGVLLVWPNRRGGGERERMA